MTTDCERVTERAEELALGLVDEPDRGDLLAHVDACPRCRAVLDELAAVADRLALTASEAEPPPGFEARAVAAMGGTDARATAVGSKRPGRRPTLLVATAVLVVLAAIGGVLIGRGTATSDQRGSALDGIGVDQLAAAPLRSANGERVGDAMILGGSPPSLWMSLPDATPGEHYRCEVVLADGSRHVVGEWSPRGRSRTWSVELDPTSARATELRVSDDGGSDVAVAQLR